MISAEAIKGLVDMDTVLEWYGLEMKRSRFMLCPFHPDTDASLKVYPGDRGFNCFGCGKNGSVIDFVMLMDNLTFPEAVDVICAKAGLVSDTKDNFRARRNQARRKRARKKNKQLEAGDLNLRLQNYNETMRKATEWTPELEEACMKYSLLEYEMELLEGKYEDSE